MSHHPQRERIWCENCQAIREQTIHGRCENCDSGQIVSEHAQNHSQREVRELEKLYELEQ
jgi:predicted ATP-dependent serine protease